MSDPTLHPSRWRDGRAGHLARAALVGIVAGFLAVAFRWSLARAEYARDALLHHLHGLPAAAAWGWIVLPVIGLVLGSLVGYVVLRFVPEARGSGIPHVKGVLLHVRAMPWRILVPVKFLGGLLGIGAGLSMGREGPTVQMGAAVGRMVADKLHVPSRTVPQLLSCGAGAGLAAAFNAPLAGFLFVIEELHRELSARTFAGALVAALSADIVTRAFSGDAPSFEITGYPALPLAALPMAALIGVSGGVLGWVLNRSLLASLTWPARLHAVPAWMLPGIAAAICGLIAWWIPEAVGGGHKTAEHLLRGQLGWGAGALCVLLVLKFALTVISYGSGAPGGIFAPMLLMGAILGAIGGRAFEAVLPQWGQHATAFQIVGMAALFSGSVRAPLTAIVLIVELTGNYQQLLALGIVCLVADLTADALRSRPIYEALLEADLRPTPGRGEAQPEISEPRSVYIGIQRGSPLEGKPIRQAGFPPGCLVVAIERGGREVLPEADLTLVPGDHVTVLLPADEPEKAMAVVRLATGL